MVEDQMVSSNFDHCKSEFSSTLNSSMFSSVTMERFILALVAVIRG